MSSYLTEAELDALQDSGLDPFTPFAIQNASMGQLSFARHYGGCRYNGREYLYIPTTDELVRNDVVKWIVARRRETARAAKQEAEMKQMEMM
ncbi:MAG TPA: hypothetical protein VN444_04250 [Verrucomicrobiae bacterium]|nr:hypothetical protein [Verrucomicrobiae bacterium]